MVIYTKSAQSGLTFSVSLPYSVIMGRVINIKRTAQVLVILTVLAELLICASLIRFNAGPVVDFVRSLSALLAGTEAKNRPINEYDFLKESIPRLKNLSAAVERKQDLLRKYFLSQLLEGDFKDPGQILSAGAEIGLDLEAAAYCAVSFEGAEDPGKAKALFQPGDRDGPEAGWKALLYYQLEPKTLFALFGFAALPGETERRNFLEALGAQARLLKKEQGRACSVGAGRIYTGITSVCFSYNQSRYCASLAAENGEVLDYDHVPLSMNVFYYPISLEQKLMNAAQHRESAQIEAVFEELRRENLEKRSLSGPMAARLADNLVATLLKTYGDVMFGHTAAEDALIRVSRYGVLPEMLNALREEFLALARREKESRLSSRHEVLLSEILELVHKKYADPRLSICYLAEQFHLSESYFSQLFKDLSGESFSAYLENLRLSRAQELLRDTRLDIEEIAQQVGYFNSTTFRRAFKRMAGISPTAFQAHSVKIS